MNLSLRDIEYFLSAVEHGHLGRAAAACAVTQPALSKSLKRLEEESGLNLLDRSGRSIRLTSAGLVFLDHARKLWAQYRDAVRHATELRVGQAGLLRIGATGATLDTVVMPVLSILLPQRPALRVQMKVALSDELNERVERGDLDLAITPIYAESPLTLCVEKIGDDDLCVAASRKHPLAMKQKLSLSDLTPYRWVLAKSSSMARRSLDLRFIEANLPSPVAALEVEHISHGTLNLVAHSDLLAGLPRTALASDAAAGLTELNIAMGKSLPRQIALLTRRNTTWSPLMTEFRDMVFAQTKLTQSGPDNRGAMAKRDSR